MIDFTNNQFCIFPYISIIYNDVGRINRDTFNTKVFTS